MKLNGTSVVISDQICIKIYYYSQNIARNIVSIDGKAPPNAQTTIRTVKTKFESWASIH